MRFRETGQVEWHPSFTSDVSTTGMYLVSSFVPTRTIDLEIELAGVRLRTHGTVLRTKRTPTSLRIVETSGFSVQLSEIPREWWEFCLALAMAGDKPPA